MPSISLVDDMSRAHAATPTACKNEGHVIMGMRIAIADLGHQHNEAVVEHRAVALWSIVQGLQEVRVTLKEPLSLREKVHVQPIAEVV